MFCTYIYICMYTNISTYISICTQSHLQQERWLIRYDDRYDLKYICPASSLELMVQKTTMRQHFAMEAMAHLTG